MLVIVSLLTNQKKVKGKTHNKAKSSKQKAIMKASTMAVGNLWKYLSDVTPCLEGFSLDRTWPEFVAILTNQMAHPHELY